MAPKQRVDALEDALLLIGVQRRDVGVGARVLSRNLERSNNTAAPPVFGGHVVHGADARIFLVRLVVGLVEAALQLLGVSVLEAQAAPFGAIEVVGPEAALEAYERARDVEGEAFEGSREGHCSQYVYKTTRP